MKKIAFILLGLVCLSFSTPILATYFMEDAEALDNGFHGPALEPQHRESSREAFMTSAPKHKQATWVKQGRLRAHLVQDAGKGYFNSIKKTDKNQNARSKQDAFDVETSDARDRRGSGRFSLDAHQSGYSVEESLSDLRIARNWRKSGRIC